MIFLSLTDLLKALKQGRIILYTCVLLCTLLALFYALTRSVQFKAEGIFKGHVNQTTASLTKALEMLDKEESYSQNEDPRALLKSYPVLQGVVESLNLQATLYQKGTEGRLLELIKVLKTEWAYLKFKRQKIGARVLDASIYVPKKLIIPDHIAPVSCNALLYSSETYSQLKIIFKDAAHYTVWDRRKKLGEGTLKTPFYWDQGHFTLSGTGKPKKTYTLTLLPQEQVIQSVQKRLKIQKDKSNGAFIHIEYTHKNRHLAAQIVNEVMEQYQIFLKKQGEKKINSQLNYLEKRQESTLNNLENSLGAHQNFLEEHLEEGMMLSLSKELEFLSQKQAEKRELLLSLNTEIERLNQVLDHPPLPKEKAELSIESARHLIHQNEQQLDILFHQAEKLNSCQLNLALDQVESQALAKTLNDPSIAPHFETLNQLQRRLIDEKNWTPKEKEQMHDEMELEKQFLIQHIEHLKTGTTIEQEVLKTRIRTLQHTLLGLLNEASQTGEKAYRNLCQSVTHFPQKWLSEQKLELNTRLHTEIIETITRMIELKNIGYHLDYLEAFPLKPALPPSLPKAPHLLLLSFLGALLGLLFACMLFILKELYLGPSASTSNLQSQGSRVILGEELVAQLGFAILEKESQSILVASKRASSLSKKLANWLQKRSDCKIIEYQGDPKSTELHYLLSKCDCAIYGVSDERLSELESLPKDTLYYEESLKLERLTLSQIAPRLTALSQKLWLATSKK